LKRSWNIDELIEHATLLPDELKLLTNKTEPSRLGFAVLLKCFQYEGRFPSFKGDIPAAFITYIARQAGIALERFEEYDWNGRTIKAHRADIRALLGFREATEQDGLTFADWLRVHILPKERDPERLLATLYERCREIRIEPPSPGKMTRLVRSALHTFEEHFCADIAQQLPADTRSRLEALLQPLPTEEDIKESGWAYLHTLKAGPAAVSLETARMEIEKLQHLRTLALPADLFSQVSPKVLIGYSQRIAVEETHEIRRHPQPLRLTLLAAWAHLRIQEVCDGLLDLLTETVHHLGAKAERKVENRMLKDFRRVTGKPGLLFLIADASLTHPEGVVREVIYPVVGEQTLRDLKAEWNVTGSNYRQQVHIAQRNTYRSYYRRILAPILQALEFRSNNVRHRPVLDALKLVEKFIDSKVPHYPSEGNVPLDGVVKAAERPHVVERDKQGKERV